MKKLLIGFLLLVCISKANAQDYRFYAGVQGGPKVSFSNLILPGQNDLNYSSYSTIKNQKGVVAGYNFKNKRLSLEGGYSLQRHGITIRFWDDPNLGKTPDLEYDFTGDQVALLTKFTINNPESKVILRAVVGGAYFMKWGKSKSNFNYYQEGDRYGFISYPYDGNSDHKFGFRPGDVFEFDFGANIGLIQAGFEVQTNLTKHLALNLSAIYQNSLKPVEVWSFSYTYNYDRGVIFTPELPGSTFSKAEAINLNLGLYYYFSKRD